MYCPNCGKKIPSKSKFCPMCGFNIKEFFDVSLNDLEDDLDENNIQEDVIIDSKVEENYEKNDGDIDNTQTEIIIEENDNIRTEKQNSNDLEDLFKENLGNNKEKKEEKFEDIIIDTEIEEEKQKVTFQDLKDDFGGHFEKIGKLFSKLGIGIRKSQEKIFEKTKNIVNKMVLEENRYMDILLIVTVISLIVPTLSIVKLFMASEGKTGLLSTFGIMLVATIVNFIITAAGPILSLKVLGINYIKNLDKATTKTIIIVVTAIVSISKLIVFLLFRTSVSMEAIFAGKFSFRIIITTIIILIIGIYFLQTLLWDKFNKESYYKVLGTISASVVAAEIISFLIGKTIIFILLG